MEFWKVHPDNKNTETTATQSLFLVQNASRCEK